MSVQEDMQQSGEIQQTGEAAEEVGYDVSMSCLDLKLEIPTTSTNLTVTPQFTTVITVSN